MTKADLGAWTFTITDNGVVEKTQPFALVSDSLSKGEGDNQTDVVSNTLSTHLEVRLLNEDGQPVPYSDVSFQISSTPRIGNNDTAPSLSSASAVTDDFGYASVSLTLGSVAGQYAVTATDSVAPFDIITFTENAVASVDESISDAKTDGNCDCVDKGGDPIILTNGDMYLSKTDLAPVAPSLISFTRNYNSKDSTSGALGYGWRHTYDRSITTVTSGKGPGATTTAYVRRPDGKTYTFVEGSSGWVTDADVHATLVSNTSGWTYQEHNITETYDSAGQLVSITYLNGRSVQLSYDGAGLLQAVTDDIGSTINLSYDPQGRIITLIDGAQRMWQYAYDANGNLSQVTNPDQTVRTYHYENGQYPHALTGITDERGIRYATYEYDANGYANASYHAGNANRIDVVYNADGTRTVTNSRGQISTYYVTGRLGTGLVTQINGPGCSTCANGNSTYLYDSANNLAEKIVGGASTAFSGYESSDAPRNITTGAGTTEAQTKTIFYDSRFTDLPTQVYEPSIYSNTDPNAPPVNYYSEIEKQYDALGNVVSLRKSGYAPDGSSLATRTTLFTYNGPAGQLTSIDGPQTGTADVTTYEYYPNDPAQGNNRARLQRVTGPLGQVLYDNIQYSATGKVVSEQRPNGLTVSYTYYPGNDRLDTMTETAGTVQRVMHWTWLPTGEVNSVTVGYGTSAATTLTFGYDDARRLVSIQDGAGNYRSFTLDTEGNVVSEDNYDALGGLHKTIGRVFDAYNRISSESQANETHTFNFATDGTLTQETDGNGIVSQYTYDGLKRLTSVAKTQSGTLVQGNALVYDAHGNITQVQTTDFGASLPDYLAIYTYDDFGNRLSASAGISPTMNDTGTTNYTYDVSGNKVSSQDSLGRQLQYQYDALNRRTSIDAPGTADDITYSYDTCFNGLGRLCSITTGSGITVDYAYDGLGDVTSYQGVGYSYDSAGRLQTMTLPSGAVVGYQYDIAGRLSTLTLNGSPLASGITYQPEGPVSGFTYGNGLTYTSQVDSAYRPTQQNTSGVLDRSYDQYDSDGNLLQVTENGPGGQAVSAYAYNWENAVETASGPFGTRSYGYDNSPFGVAERTSMNDGTQTFPYGYSTLDQVGHVGTQTYYIGQQSGWSVGTNPYIYYTYDSVGNRTGQTRTAYDCVYGVVYTDPVRGTQYYGYNCTQTSDDQWTYSYTAYNQMASAALTTLAGAQGQTSYTYNGLGQRVSKTLADGTVTQYVYGLDGALLAELDGNGAPRKEYIYFNGGLLAVQDFSSGSPVLYYVHNNHLGAPRVMTDAAGQVIWTASYDPFGAATVNEDPDGNGTSVTLNVRFPGQYYDAETGLYYNYLRYYDPEIGKYTTVDPIGIKGGLNTYAYVGGNPVMYIDSTGLICFNFGKFASEIEQRRFNLSAILGTAVGTEAVGTMPKAQSELRALGVPKEQINPYTSQLSRWSGRTGIRVLRDVGRSTIGIRAGAVATGTLVFEGYYDWGVILKAAWDATTF